MQTATTDRRPPRMRIVWEVLEAALDNQDNMVVAACRRLISAERIGWRENAARTDYELVLTFADALVE